MPYVPHGQNPCVIAINTAPRANGGYLQEMLENFENHAGLGDPSGGWPVMLQFDAYREGATQELLTNVSTEYPGYDVLLFEDDVIGCKNALLAAAQIRIPKDFGILSFFNSRDRFTKEYGCVDVRYYDPCSSRNMDTLPVVPGIYARDVSAGFMFSQAVKVSADFAAFAGAMRLRDFLGDYPYWMRDMHLGNVAKAMEFKWHGCVVPNWFQHIGVHSAVDDESPRAREIVSGNWCGLEHDALGDLNECIVNTSRLRF